MHQCRAQTCGTQEKGDNGLAYGRRNCGNGKENSEKKNRKKEKNKENRHQENKRKENCKEVGRISGAGVIVS
jgi:hypothetical protein